MPTSSLPPVTIPSAVLPSATMPAAVPSAQTVSALGRSAAAGESDADRAVTAIYGTHYRDLVRLAVLLVGDLRAAEEIVQDSFASMHHAWRRLRHQDAALSFLHRSVVARSRSAAPGPALAAAPRYETTAGEAGWRPLRAVPSGSAEPAGAGEPTRTGPPPAAGWELGTGGPTGTGAPSAAGNRPEPGQPTGRGEPSVPGGRSGAAGLPAPAGAAGPSAAGAPLGTAGATEPAGVIAALQGLPVMQREALALRLYLNLRDDQIAAAMRVSHATARGHVAGGLAAMRGVA
jgi:DNA-directed RNA polymerase specialized sigma24 family protein